MVLLNATLAVSLYVRAINAHGAAAVAMLFAVIPAVAAVLSWIILGQRPDQGGGGIGAGRARLLGQHQGGESAAHATRWRPGCCAGRIAVGIAVSAGTVLAGGDRQ